MRKSPLFWLILTLLAIVILTALGPAEKTLGGNVRVVYLHGAWVWAAMIGFVAAALVGLAGLVTRRPALNYWSRALGRTGLVFWISYLPISMWAMQTNWNGLFLAEPRWRVGLIFAIGGLILQVGVSLLDDPVWASASNIVFAGVLLMALQSTEQVMHPASPIFGSDAWRIQLFFLTLLALTLLAAWQLARIWHALDVRKSIAANQ
jgi:hypothetical protein